MEKRKNNKAFEEDVPQVNEPQADYDKSENDLLLEGLKRSYQERFYFATTLYKIQQTLNKAVITHKPDTLKK
jgi:hypothetical protein